ncbi:MAG: alpha-galactosidase [Clostridia bacterium]|nr:alpha-galactosidase [Clostridia bacterium]
MYNQTIMVGQREFIISSKGEYESVSITKICENGKVSVYGLEINSQNQKELLTITWKTHMVGVLSFWCPDAGRDRSVKQWIWPRKNFSNLYYGAPVISSAYQDGSNYLTVAFSDAVNPVEMSMGINDFEEKENIDFTISLFAEGGESGKYSAKIYVDESDRPFYESIPAVKEWWGEFYDLDNPRTVNGEYPLYSSWYNFHQNPTQEMLSKELDIASKIGMKSVIIDDGWSYDGLGTGDYFNCGDWKFAESKFPDFKAFVDELHAKGIKAALWFPVPFVGQNNPDYNKFIDKILYVDKPSRAGVLDVRYPDVREHVVQSYLRIVKQTGIDGLKLDFIDSFRCKDKSLLIENKADGMDCKTVEEGVLKLLEQVKSAVASVKEDFMIEFRQMYVGPAITRFANMLRVIDCAFDSVTNRVGIIDLRLMNYNLAVHADMLIWAKDEKIEECAKMLYNVMFGVPQLSVRLTESSEEQKELISKYLNYWTENQEIIMHGQFKTSGIEVLYSFASAENDQKKITVLYSCNDLCFCGKNVDVFNATAKEYLYVDCKNSGVATIYDCKFNKLEDVIFESGKVIKLKVPQGGSVSIVSK